jgi:uncharacterized protein
MLTAEELIALLALQPLPEEGGYYRETYRSAIWLTAAVLPSHYGTDKAASTAIYYLLTPQCFSALHRLPTDEIFHFYLGSPVQMLQLEPGGRARVITLGTDLVSGQRPQAVVPAGVWQGSFLLPGGTYALLGTTMAPGFDAGDYEPADRNRLITEYPAFAELIQRLSH